MRFRCLAIAVLLSLGTSFPSGTAVYASPDSGQVTADSLIAFASPASPLSLPRILWDVVVYPVERFTIYSEQTHLRRRLSDLFTNDAGTFGLRPQIQLGGETGTGGGFGTFVVPTPGAQIHLSGIYSGGRGQRATLNASDRSFGNSGRFYLHIDGDFLNTHHREARINGAVRNDPVRAFAIRRGDGALRLGWRRHAGRLEPVSRNVYLEGMVGYAYRHFWERSAVGGPLTDPGSTAAARLLPGFDRPMQYARVGGRLILDSRDYTAPFTQPPHDLYGYYPGESHLFDDGVYRPYRDTSYPERGGLLVLETEVASGSGGVGYVKSVVEAQGFLTLWAKERVLAIRGRLEKLHPVGSRIVPFSDFDTLGGSEDLRGYRRGYFRGLGTLTFNIEYRYPIWDSWNAYLFWDEGQVFDGFSGVTMDRFRSSWGGGITFRAARTLIGKIQVGHSEVEKALVGLVLGQEF